MDSIREHRTEEDILTEIQMEESADINNEKCFVIVEGSDDILFAKRVFCENVICIESIAGKEGVHSIIAKEPEKANLIGIRDRDYDDISQLPDRIFLYDHCCLEMMLLSNRVVTDSFHDVYYRGDRTKETYIIDMMRQLSAYSMLRRKRERESLSIPFQETGFGNIIDRESGNLEIEELFARIQQQGYYESCREEAREISDEQLWDITNGHDICVYLGRVSKNGKKDLGEEGVRNIIIACYRLEDFRETDLYRNILDYQEQRQLKFVD